MKRKKTNKPDKPDWVVRLRQGPTYVYWRWKKDKKSFAKSHVQSLIHTDQGEMLELTEDSFGSRYPIRALLKEIDVL